MLLSKNNGFTLIELTLSIALIAVVAAFSLPIFQTLFYQSDLDLATSVIVHDLRRAASLASASEGDHSWAVDVQSGSVTLYALDSGVHVVGYDEVFSLPNTLTYSGRTTYIFQKMTGEPENSGSININNPANNGTRNITINSKGAVSF